MWAVTAAEFKYYRWMFIVFVGLLIGVECLERWPLAEDLPVSMFVFFMLFEAILFWTIFKNKEKRNLLAARLPLGRFQGGMARLGVVIVYGFIVASLDIVLQMLFKPWASVSVKRGLFSFGLVFFPMVITLIGRDLILYFLRNNRFYRITEAQSRLFILYLATALSLLGVLANVALQKRQLNLEKLVGYIRHPVPFVGWSGLVLFGIGILVFTLLSIVSYGSRKSYLE